MRPTQQAVIDATTSPLRYGSIADHKVNSSKMLVDSASTRLLLCSISVILLLASAAAPIATTHDVQPQDTCTISTPTVAVAVQRSATNFQSSDVYVIAHAVCFSNSNNVLNCEGGSSDENGVSAQQIAANACCDAMKRAVRFLCLQVQTNTGKGRDSSSFLLANHSICRGLEAGSTVSASWEQSCAEHIAPIPNYRYSAGVKVEDEMMAPTHMLSIWDEETVTAKTLANGGTSNDDDNVVLSLGLIGEQFVWDEMRSGRWHSATSSPFLIASLEDSDTNSPPEQSLSIPARIMSSVSENGGMHRAHGHRIVLSMGEAIDAGAIEASGNFTVLLPLSEGLFMDIDDALQNDGECTVASVGGECKTEMIPLPRGAVVDIEQPSFASHQHVLAIRVSFQLCELHRQSHLPDIALEFTSNLHLRYQMPLVTTEMEKKNQRMHPVYIPSTFIGAGHAVVVKKDEKGGGDSDETTSVYYSIDGRQVQRNALIVEAATGHGGDYILVVTATLFASVFGSFAMIRQFSLVSRWD